MAAMVGVFSLTELGTAITQSVSQGFSGSLLQGFRANLKWSLGIILGGLGLAFYYWINKNFLLAISFLCVAIITPLTTSANLYSPYLLGKKDFRRNSFYSMIKNVVPALLLIVTLLSTQNLGIIIAVYFFSNLLVSLFLYHRTTRVYPPEKNTGTDPSLISYSGHLSFMDIIGGLANYLDKILIFHYLGAAPLAVYAFAVAPVEQLQSGKKILTTLILPRLSERPFSELQQSIPRKTILLFIYSFGLAALWAFVAPYFYKFLYPQYVESIFYSQIYSLTLLAIVGSILEQVLVAHKKTRALYINRTIVPIVKILLFMVLLPQFGLMGLIISHIIIRTFTALTGYYLLKHPHGIHL